MVERNPEKTRQRLLETASYEIHREGFQAVSLDAILASAGVTKGALYHHFSSKLELGYAVVDEVLRRHFRERWIEPLRHTDDPVRAWKDHLRPFAEESHLEEVHLGCPLNNLAQEMATVDDTFRRKLEAIFQEWREAIAAALARGQRAGTVRADVDPVAAGAFLLASFEGCTGMAKNSKSPELVRQMLRGIEHYLDSLRPPAAETKESDTS